MLSEMTLCQIAEKEKALAIRLEVLRSEIHRALRDANGNQQSPLVQSAAGEFDLALNDYMRYQLQRMHKETHHPTRRSS